MSTSYQGITDSSQSLQPALNNVDYSFLQQGLAQRSSQFESGLSQIKNDYSSILNAPLTDNANIEQRKQYVGQIQDGLKKISRTDVSLPQNIQQAENLYAPFWKDNTLLQDMSYTSYAQGELEKLNNWKNSTDKTVRDQYNADASDWVNQGLNKLRNADRNPNNYAKLQRREAIPFYNIDADIDKAYKEEENKGIDTTSTDGAATITEHNGIKSKDAFKTWYLSKVGNKYDKQLYVSESVKVQRAKDEILANNPGIDEATLNKHFAAEQMLKLDDVYNSNIASYNKVTDEWTKKHDALYTQIQNQGGKASPQDLANLNYYNDMTKAHQQQAFEYQNEWNKYGGGKVDSPNYLKTFQDITEHPEDYLSGIQKGIMADNWASGMASMNTSTKKVVDPVWQAYQNEADKNADRVLKAREIDATNTGHLLSYQASTGHDIRGNTLPGYRPDKGGWNTDKGIVPGTGIGANNTPDLLGGTMKGFETTDVAKIPSGLDVINNMQQDNIKKVSDNIYSPEGIAGSLAIDGIDKNTIIDFTEGMKAGRNGTKPTPEQAASYSKVLKVLNDNGISTSDIKGPNGMESALLQYSSIAANKLLNSGNTKQVLQGKALINTFMNVTEDRDIVLANKRNFDSAVQNEILSKPNEYTKSVITEPNGKKRFVTSNDLVPYFKQMNLSDEKGNPVDPELLADAQLKGLLQETATGSGTELRLGDKVFKIPYKFDQFSKNDPQDIYNNMLEKFGESGEISKELSTATNTILPKLNRNNNGLITQNIGWDPNIESQLPTAIGISKESSNVGNINTANTYIQGEKPGSLGLDKTQAVMNIIGSEEDMKVYTSGPNRTVTPDGQLAVEYTFKSNAPTDKTINDGVKLSDLAGKTVVLPFSPTANTPFIRALRESDNGGNFIHGNLLYDSTPIESAPTIQSSGFKSIIKPYSPGTDGKNRKCSISILKAIPDVKNPGQTKWVEQDQVYVNMLQGDNSKNPDEIVRFSNLLLTKHLNHLVDLSNSKAERISNGTPINQ